MLGGKLIIAAVMVGLAVWVTPCAWGEEAGAPQQNFVPNHADAAVFFAKYYGLFNGYISPDASLDECVSFLNDRGVYFGLLEVFERKKFTLDDCARVMGQISLVFTGEAEYEYGKVKLPPNIVSWKIFCQLNNVKYDQGYADLSGVLRKLYKSSLID